MFNISKENRLYGSLFFLQNILICVFFGFIVIYLKTQGYSESKIGIIMSTTLVVTFLSQPFIGYISDNFISINKLYLIATAAMLFLSATIPFVKDNYVTLFIVFILVSLTGRSTNSMLDSYVMRLTITRSGLDYGFTRGLGSLGYSITAIIIGFLIDRFGDNVLFITHAIVSVIIIILMSYKCEDLPIIKKNKDNNISFIAAMKLLIKNKRFIVLLVSTFILFIGISMHQTYNGVAIISLGGTPKDFGLAISIAALSEVPAMWNFYRLLDRFTISNILIFTFIVYALRFLLMVLFPSVSLIVASFALQSISYGLFAPAILRRIQELVPEELLTSANFLSASFYLGVSAAIATLIGGYILELRGFSIFYFCCFLFALSGTILLLVSELILGKEE